MVVRPPPRELAVAALAVLKQRRQRLKHTTGTTDVQIQVRSVMVMGKQEQA